MRDAKFFGFLILQMAAALALGTFVLLWPGPWNWHRYSGVILAAVGAVFLFTARYQLGKSFSVTPQARVLVTHGIYSRIRNPIYVFSFVMVAGVLLVVQKFTLFFLLPLLAVAQTKRARMESTVLEDKFGEEYRDYRRKTWF